MPANPPKPPTTPQPILWDTGATDTAFQLRLEDFDPWSDQNDVAFFIEDEASYAFMTYQESAANQLYRGVSVRKLDHLSGVSPATIKTKSISSGNSESTDKTVSTTTWPESISNVTHSWVTSYSRAKISVTASSGNSYTAVAVPLIQPMRTSANWSAYIATAAWDDFSGGTGAVCTVDCQQNDWYAVFIADNVPDNITPKSAVARIKLT